MNHLSSTDGKTNLPIFRKKDQFTNFQKKKTNLPISEKKDQFTNLRKKKTNLPIFKYIRY